MTTLESRPHRIEAPGRRRRRQHQGLVVSLSWLWLVMVVGVALIADFLPLTDPEFADPFNRLLRPSLHGPLLGTDGLGRDILSRLIYGARVSLVVGLSSVGIGLVVGGSLGIAAGYLRGWFEKAVTAVVDVLLAFPALVLLLAVLSYVGRSVATIVFLIAAVSIPQYTRIARANALAITQRDFVTAARALGARTFMILRRELLPNVAISLATFGLLAVAAVIVVEGSLSFLGLGVPPPTPTWGSMIADGRRHLTTDPHVTLIPAVGMSLTVLSLNLLGDTYRARIDSRSSRL